MNRPTGRSAAIAAAWLTAGAVGASALTGFAFAAGATGTNDSAAPSAYPAATQPPATDAPGPGGQGGPGMKGRMGGMGGPGGPGIGRLGPDGPVLHGDLVVKNKDGKVVTIRVQSGKVTAAGSGSITVASSDGYTSTWILNADTRIRRDMQDATAANLVVGDTVAVRGEVVSGNATAKVVRAFTPDGLAKAKEKRSEMQQRRQDRRGQNQPAPGATDDASLSGLDI